MQHRNLSVLAYCNGFSLWHFRATAEGLSLIDVDEFTGFFNEAADTLSPGDMILVSAKDGGKIFFVADVTNNDKTTTGSRVGLAPLA